MVKRYDFGPVLGSYGMREMENGDYVKWADHRAEVERLRGELLRALGLAATHAMSREEWDWVQERRKTLRGDVREGE